MKLEKEKAFVAKFAKAAGAGELLNVSEVKIAYEKAIRAARPQAHKRAGPRQHAEVGRILPALKRAEIFGREDFLKPDLVALEQHGGQSWQERGCAVP
jgi:hypothetical protein